MPAVILLRHGKSGWEPGGGGDDRDRPLNKRGRAAAAAIGRLLASRENVPTEAITSPALRAVETLRRAMEAGAWTCPVELRPVLYGAAVPDVLAEIRRRPDTTEVLLVVGHEPTTSDTIHSLIGGGRLRVPTATAARIDLDAHTWADVTPGGGSLAWLVPARLLAWRE